MSKVAEARAENDIYRSIAIAKDTASILAERLSAAELSDEDIIDIADASYRTLEMSVQELSHQKINLIKNSCIIASERKARNERS